MRRMIQRIPPRLLHVAGTFFSKAAAAGVQFLQTIVLSRTLGAESLGLYYVALSVYRVAESAAPLGLQTSTVREIAGAHAHGAWGSVRAVAQRSALLCALLGLFAATIAWIFAPDIGAMLDGQPRAVTALRWMAFAIIPGCIVLSLTSVLRGLGRQTLANILGSLILPLVATLAFVFGLKAEASIGAVHAFIAGQLAALLLLSLALWRIMAGQGSALEPGHSLFQSAFPFWVVSLASLANDSLGILLLGLLGTAEDAGVFGVAVRLAMPLSFLGASMQAVCDSRFAGLYRLGDHDGLLADYRASLRMSISLALGMGLTLALLAGPLLSLFGPDFVQAERAFHILLVSICLLAAFGPAGSFLSMAGKAHVNAWTAVGAMPIAAGLMVMLIPRWGATGAALATSTALAIRVIVQVVMTYRALRQVPAKAALI